MGSAKWRVKKHVQQSLHRPDFMLINFTKPPFANFVMLFSVESKVKVRIIILVDLNA